LGNTDPKLIKNFMGFLMRICGVAKKDISFSLQIFDDIDPNSAKKFWISELDIDPAQIKGKVTITKSGSIGTYRQKSQNGVLILQYHNKKLRQIIDSMMEEFIK